MSNDFFNNHRMLGSRFDFNHDGNMSLGEAGAMGAFGAMHATEMERASKEAERETNHSYDAGKKNKKKAKAAKKEKSLDDIWDDPWEKKLNKIDSADHDEVLEAIINDELDECATELLLYRAINDGVKFDAEETEELMGRISDRNLKQRLEWVRDGYWVG